MESVGNSHVLSRAPVRPAGLSEGTSRRAGAWLDGGGYDLLLQSDVENINIEYPEMRHTRPQMLDCA